MSSGMHEALEAVGKLAPQDNRPELPPTMIANGFKYIRADLFCDAISSLAKVMAAPEIGMVISAKDYDEAVVVLAKTEGL